LIFSVMLAACMARCFMEGAQYRRLALPAVVLATDQNLPAPLQARGESCRTPDSLYFQQALDPESQSKLIVAVFQ
jgi:hypothetical protein